MSKETLKFRGEDTGINMCNGAIDVLLISLIDFHGKAYYDKLIENGMIFKKEIKEYFDNYFKTNN